MQPPAEQLQHLAALCKGSGDPLRLEILRAMKSDTFGVLELCNTFDVKQSSMSHHLKVLSNAGLVSAQKEGNTIFYRRNLPDTKTAAGLLLQGLFQAIDQVTLPEDTRLSISLTKKQRAESSRQFFNKHVDKFREQQELIARYDQYAPNVKKLLDRVNLPPDSSALEVGPGEGAFLAELSPLFKTVFALDISEEMLGKAKIFSEQHNLKNVQFLLGDTRTALEQGIKANCIICNMVMHHVGSPGDVFVDLAQLLEDGGVLLVADLCHHDQDWAKTSCGDVWLGFAPEELTQRAKRASLEAKESLYLGLRNGFQVQIRRFDKATTLNFDHHKEIAQ